MLELAKKDNRIKGLILKIDSPEAVPRHVRPHLQKDHGVQEGAENPVVACIVDQGTSGGYMVALSSDYIVAVPPPWWATWASCCRPSAWAA